MKTVLWALFLSVFFVLSGCGVKENPGNQGNTAATSNHSIEGVSATTAKKYLVQLSRPDLQVSPTFSIDYRVVDASLRVLTEKTALKVRYSMPEMPQMPVTPVKVETLGPGEFRVTYDISMEGKWELILEFWEGETLLDQITYTYTIAGE